MAMVVHLVLLVCAWCPADEPTNEPYRDAAIRIREAGFKELRAYEMLAELVAFGPRVAGSEKADAAFGFMERTMEEIGLERVRRIPYPVRRWKRGPSDRAAIVGPEKQEEALTILGRRWGPPTPEGGLRAQVVEIRSKKELMERKGELRGRILFSNLPLGWGSLIMFENFAWTVRSGRGIWAEAAEAGALAVLYRSVKLSIDDHPQARNIPLKEDPPGIPGAQLSTRAADRLSACLERHGQCEVFLDIQGEELEPGETWNLVGEIPGSDHPKEVIALFAHLDTVDVSDGAHDDGAGCVHVLEAVRLLLGLGLNPKRTIRVVLVGDEEILNAGAKLYASTAKESTEKHLAAIDSDHGGFRPLGFHALAPEDFVDRVRRWEGVLEEVGIYWVRASKYAGPHTGVLFEEAGVPALALLPDDQRVFDLWHTAQDTLDKVDPRELELGAITIATLAYILAQEGLEAPSGEALEKGKRER